MFDYRKIRQQVEDYAGEFAGDFDLEGVMDELRAIDPDVQSVDDVEDLDVILQRHDVSGKR